MSNYFYSINIAVMRIKGYFGMSQGQIIQRN